uniref:Metalloprotease n=1 Tax=Tityus melici TaxID=3026321 RepID=A0AA49K9P9_9SCOR|nr:putative metalloprotease [Tityus melici]
MISLLFCASVLAISIGQTEVIYPSLETLASGMKRMKFRAFDQDMELNLEPAGDVISDNFTIIYSEGKTQATDVESLKKRLFRDPEKGSALYISEKGLTEIEGVINSKLRIEPYETREVAKNEFKAHQIIRTFPEDKHFSDAMINFNMEKSYSERNDTNVNGDECVEIEYLFLAENNFAAKFLDSEKLQVYLATVFVQVQTLMDTLNLNIKLHLIGTVIYKDNPPFFQGSLIPGQDVLNAGNIMKNMSNFLCKNEENELMKQADLVMLITINQIGYSSPSGMLFPSVIGVSYLGGACDPCKKCALIKDDGRAFSTAYLIAHESAHLIGSPHDGAGPIFSLPGSPTAVECPPFTGFIMGNTFGVTASMFSKCSRENIKYFLSKNEASCITSCNSTTL